MAKIKKKDKIIVGYEPDYWYRQSSVIPYCFDKGVLKVVLITSRKRKRWIVPKGIVEQSLGAARSAAQEAFEEAGVTGKVITPSIGCFYREKWGGTCQVEVFLMKVEKILDNWLEKDERTRKIVPVEKAADLVGLPFIKKSIKELPEMVSEEMA